VRGLRTVTLAIALTVIAAAPAAAAQAPWRAAEALRAGLFDAQSELIISGPR
jgi:hypothetical protein